MTKLYIKYVDNRRLWSRADHRYATVRDVLSDLEHGHEVQVLMGRGIEQDTKKRDVTKQVLLQVLVHRETRGVPRLSVEKLTELLLQDPDRATTNRA